MKVLYIDPFSGMSGNMFIGAMLDAGFKIEPFIKGLAPLGISLEDVIVEKREKAGVSATYFNLIGEAEKLIQPHDRGHTHVQSHDHASTHEHVYTHEHGHRHNHRNLDEIYRLIEQSDFGDEVKALAKDIYLPLAVAEARVHGADVDTVHFHEVGETDAIVDVLGAAYFTVLTDVEAIYTGVINPGGGSVVCAHGTYPVPAPAVAHLLGEIDVPIGGVAVETELLTPTGAAILKGIGAKYMARPEGRVRKVAYGAGTKDLAIPNVLRIFFLETDEAKIPVWFSCNIDDMTGESLGFSMDKLFEAGATDVSFTPIYMKKNRPAHRIDVLCDTACSEAIKEALFTHTTTLGIKRIPLEKIELPRQIHTEEVAGERIRTKIAHYKNRKKVSAEYEDLKELADKRHISLDEARGLWQRR